MSSKTPKVKRSFRLSYNIDLALDTISKSTKLTKTEICELSLSGYIANLKESLMYKGVDLREYAQLYEKRQLRRIQSFKRGEFKSRILFKERLEKDILLFFRNNKKESEIFELLEMYKQEAKE